MQTKDYTFTQNSGYTLIELLMAILVFAFVAVIATQTIAVSIKNSRKGESTGDVRRDLDYAFNIMERVLHGATGIKVPTGGSRIEFYDQSGNLAYFECTGDGRIASNSALVLLTSDKTKITNCPSVFSYDLGGDTYTDKVDIKVIAESKDILGAEGSTVTVTTTVLLRNYGSF